MRPLETLALGLLAGIAACTYEARCPKSSEPRVVIHDPSGLALAPDGTLYVSNGNGDGSLCSGYLAQVDPASARVTRILPAVIGGGTLTERISLLGEIALLPDRAFVVERTQDSLLVFDLASGEAVARGWTGISPYGLALGPTAAVPIDCKGGRVTGSLLVTANLSTDDLSVFVAGSKPTDLFPAAVRCDASGQAFSNLLTYPVDGAGNRIAGTAVRGPVEVVLNPLGPTAYVDYQLYPSLSLFAIDPATWPATLAANFEAGEVSLSSYSSTAGARGLAVNPAGSAVYVATRVPPQLVAVDPVAGKVSGQLALDADPGGVAVDPVGTVWVALTTAAELIAVDAASFRPRSLLRTDPAPFALVFDPPAKRLYVGNVSMQELQVVATDTPRVLSDIR